MVVKYFFLTYINFYLHNLPVFYIYYMDENSRYPIWINILVIQVI